MKKFMKFAFMTCICAVMAITSIIFTACGGNPGNVDKDDDDITALTTLGVGMLANCSVNVDEDDTSLAVAVDENDKGYLAKLDSENKLSEIKFVYGPEGIEISQNEVEASLVSMVVTKKFTYITFAEYGFTAPVEHGYTTADYFGFDKDTRFACDEHCQSFVIDNATRKIYPTNDIGTFTGVSENFVNVLTSSGQQYHELSINPNGDLEATPLVPNGNIDIFEVMVDKFGNVFALNDTLDEVRDGICFCVDVNGSSRKLMMGDDGIAYKFNMTDRSNRENITLECFDENLQLQPVNIDGGMEVRISDTYLIKDNKIFCISGVYEAYIPSYGVDVIYCTSNNSDGEFGYAGEINDDNNTFVILEHDIIAYEKVGAEYVFRMFDTDTLQFVSGSEVSLGGKLTIGDRFNGFIGIRMTEEAYDGTRIKRLYIEEDTIKAEIIVDATYTKNVVTIQPLN